MTSVEVLVNDDKVCSVDRRTSDFISVRYMLFSDAISLEVSALQGSKFQMYYEGLAGESDQILVELSDDFPVIDRISDSRIIPMASRGIELATKVELVLENSRLSSALRRNSSCEIIFSINNISRARRLDYSYRKCESEPVVHKKIDQLSMGRYKISLSRDIL